MTTNASRRLFLRQAGALSAVAGGAAPFALNLAAIGTAAAQTAPSDYKALVCMFMYGGNDHSNMIVPFDTAGYDAYATSRTNLALPQASLLPLDAAGNASLTGRQVAMRAEMAPLKALYDAGQLAVFANVGTLVVPTNMTEYRARSVPLPPSLFSHNDQQTNWQVSPTGREGARIGWAGRMGDLFASGNQFPVFTCMSASGNAVLLSGTSTTAMQIGNGGAVRVNAFTGSNLFGSTGAPAALRTLMTAPRTAPIERDYSALTRRADEASAALTTALAGVNLTTVFPNTGLGTQLRNVARVIAARGSLGARRQIFHVSIGGFDQHSGLVDGHGPLWTTISNAVTAFQAAMVELGLADKVTLFSASDFGRTLNSNGEGSDHGWGAHHFAVGGAVRGRQVVGAFPTVTLRGPEDVGRGNLLPTTAVVQYTATMATWFGVPATDLSRTLPGTDRFSNIDLGFMRAT
jgi:uncharacterized protein (DUF1501 family)